MAGLKEHIFLIGFMGCGKSTNAACLAEMTVKVRMKYKMQMTV